MGFLGGGLEEPYHNIDGSVHAECGPELQAALGAQLEQTSSFFEMLLVGRSHLQLDQWIGALEGKLLFSNLKVDSFAVRLTEPQARGAFFAASSALLVDPREDLPAVIPAMPERV